MTAILRNNSGTAASSVVSPTSIVPALSSASLAGTLLRLVVAVTGTTPSITTPAGWTALQNNVAPTGLAVALFEFPNNPGGITTVTVTVGGTGGGAAAAIFEFTGAQPGTNDANVTQNGTGTSFANLATPATLQTAELLFYVAGFAAATLTPSNSGAWSGVIGAAVSTSGVPNAQVASFWAITTLGPQPTIGGSFSASVVNQENLVRTSIPGSDALSTGAGGASFVGQSLNPAGSLQVPQPIAPGNFFSGTTGSF